MTIQVRCFKTANNAHTAVASIAPGYTGWTAVAPYADTAPVVGDLIVVVGLFTLTSGNVTQSAGTGSYTFLTANGDPNASTNPYTSWCAYRQYTSGDTGPTFAWSGTTTAYCYLIFALTSSGVNGSVSFDASGTPKVDTSSTTAHTPNTASASTALDAAIVLNAARYQTSGSHAISMTTPCVGYSAIHIAGYAGATGFFANSCSAYMDTPVGAGTITPGSETFNESLTNNAYTLLASEFIPVPPYAGGPQGWSSPAGIRAAYVRTGICMASQIPFVVTVSLPVITTTSLPGGITGQPYSATLAATGGTGPYTWSISSGSLPAGLTLNSSTGVISGTPNSPPGTASFTVKVTDANSNTATQPLSITIGVVSSQWAVRSRIPRTGYVLTGTVTGFRADGAIAGPVNGAGFGSGNGSRGGPLQNPNAGPAFRQATAPARARITPPPPRGRTGSNLGGPVRNPVPPAVRLPQGPARAKFLPPPLRGRMAADWGVILFQNPNAGPPFTQATTPARARITQSPPRGRIASSPGKLAAVPQPPKIYPLQGPVRAGTVPPFSKGRVYSRPGAPVRNPQAGPAFHLPVRAIQARIPQAFSKGRIGSNPGTPVPPPLVKPPFRAQGPVQARQPLARRGTCRTIKFLPAAGNPQQGPVFQQATAPARIRPSLPPRGRIGSNPGVAVFVPPPPAGPVFVPSHQALRARLPQQPFLRGRAGGNKGAPLRNPGAGPAFSQALHPVAARIPLPARGRIASSPGGPVQNPVPPAVAPFRQLASPPRIRPALPPRGRVSSSPGAPLRNPHAGPAFRQASAPARIRVTLPPRGRTSSNAGAPVVPPPPFVASAFYPAVTVRAKLPFPGRGICRTIRFYPLPTPPVFTGAPFYSLPRPVRAPIPQPARGGRIASSPGAPVQNPNAGPQLSAGQPAGIRVIFLRTGDVQQTPRYVAPPPPGPVTGPAFIQAASPARARIAPAPRGRVYSRPGAPLHNPGAGPAFRQSTHPVQARFPLPPRGRTGGNPGTPPPPPPHPARVYPAQGPARTRITPPPRGRIASGKGAPVRNPQPGPVFRSAVRPIRAVIPQNAPRGRTSGNPGGPVANIPFATLRFRTGTPYFQWDTEDPGFQWDTSSPGFQWATGDPEAG